jgi:hypothetical protein
MKSCLIKVSVLACAGIFAGSLAIPTFAQGRPPSGPPAGAGPPANNNPRIEDRGREANESRLRSAEMDAAVESDKDKQVQAAIVHMKEDFSRIQVVRNEIARNLVARKPLDYELVAEQTAEIEKRAKGLNTYMMARRPEDKPEDTLADLKAEEMVGALVKLCKLIDSFTENPSLKNAKTVDAKEIEKAKQNKARADQDLLAIMKLSESIQRKSANLKAPK